MSGPGSFPIVGVGASAGGIEALEGLLRGLPAEPGLALVVVTHLSPDRESLLHEILSRYTDMPVRIAADGMAVETDHIYVMPPDAILTIERRILQMRRTSSRRERKPIDIFFSALAVDLGELAGGIILSGGDGDGTLGVKAIKERGGVTLAQVGDGFGPQHPDMPNTAISSGLIDFAVPADEMGTKLVDFVASAAPFDEKAARDGTTPDERSVDEALPEIYGLLRNQIGHDFSGYKTKTFARRVRRRMQVTQITSVEAYVERLRRDPQEVGALFRDLLINVTNFFRDEDAFATLAKTVVPALFEGRGADDTVRIWVPGCATGEEVFSIAILVREHMDRLTAVPRVQIFATDIDERALVVARAARYPGPLLDSVSPERRKRFFVLDGGIYIVSKDVRELCIFSPHSVLRDPPFSHIDMVSCRNLLIYFGMDAQNQVIPTFHYALRPDGYLFLGSAENVSQFGDLFAPIDKRHKIFRRRSDIAPAVRLPILWPGLKPGQTSGLVPRRLPLGGTALRQAVDEQVLDRFAPPHVVVNRDGDVIYFSNRTGKYLEAPAGAPSRQLLTMARKGLRLDLRMMFRDAVESGRTATRNGISLESDNGGVQIVDLTIEPLGDRAVEEPLFLVLFADQGRVLSHEEALSRVQQATQDDVAAQTERELRETRDRLQSTIEEYETALEELKSSNEELVSVNEEMQSTNEELEASKEELQSVNEELHTVNSELNSKVEALDRANNDLQNLFESTDVATVFLDRSLVIRSFTPAVSKVFNILPSDKGRPITDLSSKLDLAGFADDIQTVFREGTSLEKHVDSIDRATKYLVRLAPYRDGDQRIEGQVVTFIDVTSLATEARQQVLIGELQHRTRNLLAVVQSLAQQTLGKGSSLEGFAARLGALGRVQSLVGGAVDAQTDLGDIVRLELQAIGAPADKVTISGSPVALDFELVQTLGLALHELATNAVKYGALRSETGRLSIAWTTQRDGQVPPTLVLDWRETGVSIPQQPSRRGFGRDLIEKALRFTLKAKSDLNFDDGGVSCRIELPLPTLARDTGHR